jgi:hypothetical protein
LLRFARLRDVSPGGTLGAAFAIAKLAIVPAIEALARIHRPT